MDWRGSQIRAEAEARGITHLVHFTPFPNLHGIVAHGLRSRTDLEANGLPFLATDHLRLDGRPGATSLSITNIHRSMFMKKAGNSTGDWAILHIQASVLWTAECDFCFTNAASNEMRWRRYRSAPKHFSLMFADHSEGHRDRLGLALCQPTYQDAEVQVWEAIPPDLIIGVVVVGRSSLVSGAQRLMDHLNDADGGDRDAISWEVYEGLRSPSSQPNI